MNPFRVLVFREHENFLKNRRMSQINFIHRQKSMARAENRPHGLVLALHGAFEPLRMPSDVMHETF